MAVLKSKMPNASVRQLYEALEQTGKPIIDTRIGADNRVKKRISLMDALNVLDTISSGDSTEPDDAPAQAKPIAINLPQTRHFDVPNDHDWVVLQAQANRVYRLETLNLSTETDTVLEVYSNDTSAGPLAYNDDVEQGVDQRSMITYTAPVNGPIYLQVYDWNSGAFLNTQFDILISEAGTAEPTITPESTTLPNLAVTAPVTASPTVTPSPTPAFKVYVPVVQNSK